MRRACRLAAVVLALVVTQPSQGQDLAADSAADSAANPVVDPALEVACVMAENNALEGISELAANDDAYLVLDMAASEIAIALHGVPLRSFPVLAAEITAAPERSVDIWETHRAGTFSPARIEMPPEELPLVLEGETESVVQIHLVPEKRFPAPPEYRLSFATGLLIEIYSEEGASSADRGLGARIASWFGKEPESMPTLRIRMDAAPAGDLYRALPPEVALVIEPDCK
jgi:hypothetical protein